jgi:hypothetical protein
MWSTHVISGSQGNYVWCLSRHARYQFYCAGKNRPLEDDELQFLQHLAQEESNKETVVKEAENKAMQRLQEMQKAQRHPAAAPSALLAKPRPTQKRQLGIVKKAARAAEEHHDESSERRSDGEIKAGEPQGTMVATVAAGTKATPLLTGYDSSDSSDDDEDT